MLGAPVPLYLAAAFGAAVPAGAGAPVAPSTSPVQATLVTDAPTLLALGARLEETGRLGDAGAAFAALADDPDPDVRAEARVQLARIYMRLDQPRRAALLLRQVADERPKLAAPRLMLAQVLAQIDDIDGAWRELRAVSTTNLPPTVARFVDRLSASLQASKPFGVQVELALAPDSNVNRATRSDTLGTVFGDFTLDEDAKAKSGLGAAIRGMAHARLTLSDNIGLVARLGTETNLYRDKDFNDISFDLSAGPEFRLGRTRLSAEGGVVQQWYGMAPYQRGLRVTATAIRPLGAASQARLDIGIRWTDNKLNDLQDGNGKSARVRFERALSTRLLVSASLGADRYKADDPAYSTRSWAGGITAYREMGRVTLSAGVEMARLKADERLLLLPEARRDRLTRFHIGAVYRQLTVGGFAPMTRVVVERNQSSVEYYDYKRIRTEFGIARAF